MTQIQRFYGTLIHLVGKRGHDVVTRICEDREYNRDKEGERVLVDEQ